MGFYYNILSISSGTIKQLYIGIFPPLLSVGIIQSINFSIYEFSKFKINEIMQSKEHIGKYLNIQIRRQILKTTNYFLSCPFTAARP